MKTTKTIKPVGLQIVQVPIELLKPALYNPRGWGQADMEQLKTGISGFGMLDPLIINGSPNRKNNVIGGHMRLEALKQLGYKEVPCVYVNIPEEERERELNLRLNRNTGRWDWEKLKEFDINLLLDVGFDNADLSSIWDESLGVEDDDFNVKEALEKAKDTDIKLGDIFQLGPHKIICGDSQNLGTILKLMGKEHTSMLYTDPVYNISLDYGKGIGGKRNYGGEAVEDSRSRAEYERFLSGCIENVLDVCYPDCHFFVWSDEIYVGLIQQIFGYLNIQNKRTCIWIKDNQNPTPKIAFNKVTEFCSYGVIGKPYLNENVKNLNEVLNKEVSSGNRLHDDILDLLNIWLVKRLSANKYTHATEKPATLHEKALRRCTKPDDIVLDVFSGSGSIMVACDQLKRRAFMADITPAFVQLTLDRYEKLTGQKPVKLN